MDNLPELPSRVQDDFEADRVKAELQYAKRGEQFPHHPQFADGPLHQMLLIQKVFLTFCKHARSACRAGDWTPTQAAAAVDAAWPAICDFYVVRERGALSEEQKSKFRAALWRVVNDDQQWTQHLSELAALAEGARATAAAPSKLNLPTKRSRRRKTRPSQMRRKAEKVNSPMPVPQPGHRKRGRPQTIPDEMKTAAAELKAAGGTNKEAAALLYNTQYPTDQQRRNVPGILRHYQQRTKRPSSPVSPRSASPKPRQNKG